ncbi:hypothetical protein BpHYR1_049815 [Brachionus plicatilis]|uniref:Uncharacterized protein n=1 Tax=Brachionus plicatilis TaxID=10195 RepID=A0A3M7PZN1_BRAPC|nr:hypothetical protein BpHYR1_049815 [Brachionus plicatilis]
MISSLNSIRIVKVNRENWKLACCYRLKLMNFNDIGMDIPLNNKPKRGAKKKTRSCLQHQPFDCIQNEENAILESDQDSEIESEPTQKSSKKQKPNDAVLSIEIICKTCNAVMKKKRGFRNPSPIGEKRKPGRPAKAKQALIVQNLKSKLQACASKHRETARVNHMSKITNLTDAMTRQVDARIIKAFKTFRTNELVAALGRIKSLEETVARLELTITEQVEDPWGSTGTVKCVEGAGVESGSKVKLFGYGISEISEPNGVKEEVLSILDEIGMKRHGINAKSFRFKPDGPITVCFESTEVKMKVLKEARNLRNSVNYKKVYIHMDLTKSEMERNKELRKQQFELNMALELGSGYLKYGMHKFSDGEDDAAFYWGIRHSYSSTLWLDVSNGLGTDNKGEDSFIGLDLEEDNVIRSASGSSDRMCTSVMDIEDSQNTSLEEHKKRDLGINESIRLANKLACDKFIPKIRVNPNHKPKPPWFTKEISEMMRRKSDMWHRFVSGGMRNYMRSTRYNILE